MLRYQFNFSLLLFAHQLLKHFFDFLKKHFFFFPGYNLKSNPVKNN